MSLKLKYSINFRIEKRKDSKRKQLITENVPIRLDFTYDGNRLTYFTGYRIDADKWIEESIDSETGEKIKVQRVKRNATNRDGIPYNIINKHLEFLKSEIESIYFKAKSNNEFIDNEIICSQLLQKGDNPKITADDSNIFWKKWDEYIKTHKVSEGRRKHLKSVKKHLERFQDTTRKPLSYKSITLKMLKDFEIYLFQDGRDESQYEELPKKKQPRAKSQNTICGIMKIFRAFLNWSMLPQNGAYIKENPFSQFQIKGEVYGAPICMTKQERDYLYDAKISDERLARVRDIFCFQCFVGCRVGDLIKLTKDNIIDNVLVYSPDKTKENPTIVRVPISKKAKAILDKYDFPDGKLLPFITDQKYNDYLKELFRFVELTRSVTQLNRFTHQTEQVPLSEIASSHLARRTFIHILHSKVKDSVIASMSGHVKGSRAFNRYYDVDDNTRQEAIDKYLD